MCFPGNIRKANFANRVLQIKKNVSTGMKLQNIIFQHSNVFVTVLLCKKLNRSVLITLFGNPIQILKLTTCLNVFHSLLKDVISRIGHTF